MPDRTRDSETNRTPEAVTSDGLTVNPALLDLSDFSQGMKAGALLGDGVLDIGATDTNLIVNGSFEDGTAGWTALTGAFSVSGANGVTDGILAARVVPTTVDSGIFVTQDGFYPLPAGVMALTVAADLSVAIVLVQQYGRLSMDFTDDSGAVVGSQWNSGRLKLTPTPQTLIAHCRVPAGATRFSMSWYTTSAGLPGAIEVVFCDNCIITNLATLESIHTGTGFFAHGIHGLMADKTTLSDQGFSSTLGTFVEWGNGTTERVSFAKDATWDGLALCIEANVYGRMANTNAATRAISGRVDISLDNGATWNLGPVFSANVGASGGGNSFSAAWAQLLTTTADQVTTAVVARVMFTQTSGGLADVFGREGYVIVKMFPGRQ